MVSAEQAAADIRTHFGDLSDPRRREPVYPLFVIVFMTCCAVLLKFLEVGEATFLRWQRLKAIGMSVNITQREGQEQTDIRNDLLSRNLSADRWGIENRLHRQLDVTFGEDPCRVRTGHADAALSLLKNEPTAKVGIRNKRLTAGWDEEYLTKVLYNSRR